MTTPALTIIGHTTGTTSRVLAVFTGKDINAARIACTAGGATPVAVDAARIDGAPPYRLARFEIKGLPPDAKVDYCVAGAADPAALPSAAQLLGAARPPGKGGTFKTLPMPSQRPPRVAFVSCNGVHTSPEANRYQLWRALKGEIDKGNVDLVIFGGDQIYADPIWMQHDAHDTFRGVSPEVARELLVQQYRDWYLKSWSPPEVQAVLSSCPSVMMWDDHDIYDGYGSHDDDLGPSGQQYFVAAKQAFSEFQASHNPEPLGPSSFAYAFELGDVGFLVLDGRSNRAYSRGHILGDAQLGLVDTHLQKLAQKQLKHLFVVAGVPIMHAPVGAALGVFEALPGTEEAEDDLRDSWAAPNNLSETRRLLLLLFNFGKASGAQVSILSGDVHVATIGAIESSLPAHCGANGGKARIHQVVSSGIGYMPPTGVAAWIIKKAIAATGGSINLVGNDIVGQLLPFQGATDRYLMARRNFAIVKVGDASGQALDAHRNVWVDYFCEEAGGVVVREQCLMKT